MRFKGETIWIVGASSGIGAALAHEFSKNGAHLILSARRKTELEKLNQKLGGQHHVIVCDVTHPETMEQTLTQIRQQGMILDRAIYMAAIAEPHFIKNMDLIHAKKLIETNVFGCLAFTKYVLDLMRQQKHGQIVLCGSIAAYAGLPMAQPYGASKAALANFAQSLAAETPRYIDVKLISPGFVKTAMTDKFPFFMPGLLNVQQAANTIAKQIKTHQFEVHFPKKTSFLMKLLNVMPNGLSVKLVTYLSYLMKNERRI